MYRKIKKTSNKIISKVRRTPEELPVRITNDTVEEHREKILAGGRKFKYPMQYVKHRLVYTAAAISILVGTAFMALCWWELYPSATTNDFFYKVTRVISLPVANVDGQQVPYQDYLMKFKSSIYYIEHIEQVNLNNADGKIQLDYFKTQAMHEAVLNAYAQKIANEKNISIDQKTIDEFIKQQRQSTAGEVSLQTYDTVIADYYGWTYDEYTYAIKNILLREKVAYAVDSVASKISSDIVTSLKTSSDIRIIAQTINESSSRKVFYEESGWLPKGNNDGGLSRAAASMTAGQVSTAFVPTTGDGYYFIKLNDINDTQVNYSYIKVPLKTFADKVAELEASGGVRYYINMPAKE